MALASFLKNVIIYTQISGGVLSPVEYLTVKDEIEQPAPIVQEEIKQEPLYYEMEATFYGPDCTGCIGITAAGYDVRKTIYAKGLRVIAVDPIYIKLGSIVHVDLEDGQSFKAIAGDTGGDIKHMRIDVLVSSEKESFKYGRQKAKVTILEGE